MNMLEALALLPRATSDRPANSDTAATPGVFVSNCTTLWLTTSVRWSEAPSGSWRKQKMLPLSWDGMNPVGTLWKPNQVSTSKAA